MIKKLKFELCIEKIKKSKRIQKKMYLARGKHPIVSQENELINGYCNNDEAVFKIDSPVIVFGEHTRKLKFIDFDFVVGADGIKIFKPIASIHPKYFYYQLILLMPKNIGYSRHYRLIKNLLITFPPLDEQRAIVGKLDAVFENIDKAVKLAQCNASNAEALFKKSLEVTYKSNWSNTTELEKLTKITSSKRIYKSDYVKKGIPFYRIKEIKELANKKEITKKLFISEDKFKKIKEKFGVPKEGDILLTAVGTIGEVYVVKLKDKFYFKDGNVLWLKDIKHIDSEFLRYSILSFVDGLNNMSQGTAHSALTIEKLKKHHITMPSKEEQLNIVNRLDNLLSTCNMLKKICETKVKQLSDLKTSLLRQMLVENNEVAA